MKIPGSFCVPLLTLLALSFASVTRAQYPKSIDPAQFQKEFGTINFSPEIILTLPLRKAGATTEVKGAKLQEIRAAISAGDWNQLDALLTTGSTPTKTNEDGFKELRGKILNTKLNILLKMPEVDLNGKHLYLVTFPKNGQLLDISTKWEKHPDGTGYFHQWKPNEGDAVINYGNTDFLTFLNSFETAFRKRENGIRQREKLGEIPADKVNEQIESARAEFAGAVKYYANLPDPDPAPTAAPLPPDSGIIGASMATIGGKLTVYTIFPDKPAAKAGIVPGDRIEAIDGVSTASLPLNDCVARLRGKIGTQMTVSVLRAGRTEPVIVTLERVKPTK